ncbi:MAG: adenylate/guanylate cyclase domain-containing protein [Desulfobacterales bacterium]|nr:adenylate/guanylate cyclase domain-containing protein [Desulfobacterales bacterium]
MKPDWNDLHVFKRQAKRSKNVMACLLRFSRRLLKAEQAGVVYGSDATGRRYVRPSHWDRGIFHLADGRGIRGVFIRYFGPGLVRRKSLSPIPLYGQGARGESRETPGVIAHVLRNHRDYYRRGVKIIILHPIDPLGNQEKFPSFSYDGNRFGALEDIQVNMGIVQWFKARNFLSAYIPDYGAIVFNTICPSLLALGEGGQLDELKRRLDLLIEAVEMASIISLGRARGTSASRIIQRKELKLRRAWDRVNAKAEELNEQKRYLRALGGVTLDQVHMEPISIDDGVYAFIDMVGSVKVLGTMAPRDYFFVLKHCHEITADIAFTHGCRLDNFIGDSVFLEHVSVFDPLDAYPNPPGIKDRLMIMTMALGSFFSQVNQLKQGCHASDPQGLVKGLLEKYGIEMNFRAGMDYGNATIGPLGSRSRRVITAIGAAVNTASRLEHTGKPGAIHVEERLLDKLRSAEISSQTPLLERVFRVTDFSSAPPHVASLDFLEGFKTRFQLGDNFITPRSGVAYKEFARENTCLIGCIPRAG